MNPLPFINFHSHHPAPEGELSLGCEEHGLDRRLPIPMEEQEEEFRQHIRESEQGDKPLVVHCVRCIEEVLRIRKEMHPRRPWIMHGFRGKPQQLQSLLAAGLYVSFGLRYNRESLLACPMDRLLLETDDEPLPIAPLYREVAELKQIDLHTLKQSMAEKAEKLFGTGLFA